MPGRAERGSSSGQHEHEIPHGPDLAHEIKLAALTESSDVIDRIRLQTEKFPDKNSHWIPLAIDYIKELYGNKERGLSTIPAIMHPLKLAVAAPSEDKVSSKVTIIRLLHDVSEDFDIDVTRFDPDIAFGIRALTRLPSEKYSEYLQRLAQADKQRPDLKLGITKMRDMLGNIFDPIGLPAEVERKPGVQEKLSRQIKKYEDTYHIITAFKNNEGWIPTLAKGFEIAKLAISDPKLKIAA